MKRISLGALFAALLIVLCPAIAAGQPIGVDEPEPQGPGSAAYAATHPATEGVQNALLSPAERAQLSAASEAASAATAAAGRSAAVAATAQGTADKALRQVGRLGHRVGDFRREVNGLNDAVQGEKDKDGKRSGGLVLTAKTLVEWKNQLVADNGDLWWVAAKRGHLDEAIAVTPAVKVFFAAARVSGFCDPDGTFNAGLFFEAEKKQNERISSLEENESATKKEVDGKAPGWLQWPAWIGAFGVVVLATLKILKK